MTGRKMTNEIVILSCHSGRQIFFSNDSEKLENSLSGIQKNETILCLYHNQQKKWYIIYRSNRKLTIKNLSTQRKTNRGL